MNAPDCNELSEEGEKYFYKCQQRGEMVVKSKSQIYRSYANVSLGRSSQKSKNDRYSRQ
jgi:hypothetical protein